MKREELARSLARREGVPAATARDRVDAVVHRILKKLKAGRPAELAGIGRLMVPRGPK